MVMRLARRHPRRRLAYLALAVVCGTGLALGLAGTESAARAVDRSQCEVITGLTEKTVQSNFVGKSAQAPMTSPGDALSYYDDIENAAGAIVGHAAGYVTTTYVRPSDGHVFVFYDESVQLPQGILHDSGTVDESAVNGGAWARFAATGTAGAFLGQSGTREWQLVAGATAPTATVRIELCPS
jgi:hypothetical protein